MAALPGQNPHKIRLCGISALSVQGKITIFSENFVQNNVISSTKGINVRSGAAAF